MKMKLIFALSAISSLLFAAFATASSLMEMTTVHNTALMAAM